MAHYRGVDRVAREVTKKYHGVDNVARNITKAYHEVDGVARLYFQAGTPIGEMTVGSSVFMNVDGAATEFLVVHQGLPDATLYDNSCDGTWLLMKDIYCKHIFDTTDNDYSDSSIHIYLNNEFVNLFDGDIKSVIKQVKIPYTNGPGDEGSLAIGTSGFSTKVFLLSYAEVGFTLSDGGNKEGEVLEYFSGAEKSDRIGYFNGSAIDWWLRSPNTTVHHNSYRVSAKGELMINQNIAYSNGVRPALILPSETQVDGNINVIA